MYTDAISMGQLVGVNHLQVNEHWDTDILDNTTNYRCESYQWKCKC